ncbi:hypothetical protein HaLaN_05353 [Haematococcus lacustris]|uniref:Uncharacterized protein n=1 Tax=Haematococcus lacustris TaxID=44745 RepID=A0A699Z3U5_HAELA|nr:hypothetical protein HaLaN_05353 [Haematococcus lacustris]
MATGWGEGSVHPALGRKLSAPMDTPHYFQVSSQARSISSAAMTVAYSVLSKGVKDKELAEGGEGLGPGLGLGLLCSPAGQPIKASVTSSAVITIVREARTMSKKYCGDLAVQLLPNVTLVRCLAATLGPAPVSMYGAREWDSAYPWLLADTGSDVKEFAIPFDYLHQHGQPGLSPHVQGCTNQPPPVDMVVWQGVTSWYDAGGHMGGTVGVEEWRGGEMTSCKAWRDQAATGRLGTGSDRGEHWLVTLLARGWQGLARGFQPAGLVALRLLNLFSQGCWPVPAELTRLVRSSFISTTLPAAGLCPWACTPPCSRPAAPHQHPTLPRCPC